MQIYAERMKNIEELMDAQIDNKKFKEQERKIIHLEELNLGLKLENQLLKRKI